MSDPIRIQLTRFSAFYSPLIATIAGGFLAEEGFAPQHSVAPPGRSAIEGLVQGTLDVFQHAGLVTRRHRWQDAIGPPPDA